MENLKKLEEKINKNQKLLLNAINLNNKAFNGLADPKNDLAMTFSFLSSSVLESSHSFLILSDIGKFRDCYAISRMIFELTLNIGYFGAKGKDEVDKALKYYHQKSYRDLNRFVEISGFKFGIGLKDFENIIPSDKLKESLEFYTTKKGNEIRSWTNDSVIKKLEIIIEEYGDKIGLSLLIALYFIYRNSSEIIHGTLYGNLFERGLTKPEKEQPDNDKKLLKYKLTYINFLLICIILLNYAVLLVVDKSFTKESFVKEFKTKIIDHIRSK